MVNYANRGKSFETMLERTNRAYAVKGIAVIDKVPTDVTVIRKGPKIVNAFFKEKSTVDFMGLSHGRGIAFDAKSTKEVTRFPLSNIKQHQVNFLKKWQDQGGISFILVHFEKKGETYLFKYNDLQRFWDEALDGGKKSIKYEWFVLNCDLAESRNGILLDYIKVIST